MGTLQSALAWARRGFRVFPLQENTRLPALGADWREIATNDEDVLRRLWTDPVMGTERDYNIGCACAGMVVLDVDVKHGKDGYNKYLQHGGHFDTLVVRTTTGGYHCYFYGPDSSNAPIDEDGVDVRSANGYVVAPGSSIDGVYYQVVNDRAMASVPPSIERRLTPVQTKHVGSSYVSDDPATVQAAINFLQTTALAVQGARGDDTTFVTAARLVREFALSIPTAHQLLLEFWNPHCSPPWEPDELYQKVENAAQYGSAPQGVLSPEFIFQDIHPEPPPSVFQASGLAFGNAILPTAIPARPWLMDRILMRGAVTTILAAGSAGKSSLGLSIAAHVRLGRMFAGQRIHEACKVVVYNSEDDVMEQSRRLVANCMAHDFDYQHVKNGLMVLSADEIDLSLVFKEYNKPIRNHVIVDQLVCLLANADIGLLIVDPLVDIHGCDENDNGQMNYVMRTLRYIAKAANVAVLVMHHTSKSGSRGDDRTGNADIGRGAAAIINSSRVAFTLCNAGEQDMEDYGMQESERRMWARLDDAKMNLTLAEDNAVWFKRTGVKIASGDIVGVLKHDILTKDRQHIRTRVANILIETMTATSTASMTLSQAVAVVKEGEPLWANHKDTEIKSKLEGLFASAIDIRGHSLQVKRDPDSKSNKPLLVMF